MTPQEEKDLRMFETRVRQLILAHQELLTQCEQLRIELTQKDESLKNYEAALEQARTEYQILRTAKMLTLTGEDQHEAKARVTKLIREIDKCISLLNV